MLHSVSAAELKAEEMIKLPVLLQTRPHWQQCLADAIGRRDALQALADEAPRGCAVFAPLVLSVRAAPLGVETLDFDKLRQG